MAWLEGTKAVKMKKVRKGDFIVGLDNGYVIDSEAESTYLWKVTMHDQDGEECYIVGQHDMRVTVRLPREPFVGL